MEITIYEEKISHFTFHGEKKGPITSHENTLYHPLNSSIRIQIKAWISTLCSQFIPQNINALLLAIDLLLVSKELFFHHGCQYTTVKGWWSHPPVTAIGTTTPTLVERGWRWKTMITCTTCYRCTILWQRERLYCFFAGSACCYT